MSGSLESVRDVKDLDEMALRVPLPPGWDYVCFEAIRACFLDAYGSDTKIGLDTVKDQIVLFMKEKSPLDPSDLRRTFDALHFHAVIHKTPASATFDGKNKGMVLDRFKTENLELNTLRCSYGAAAKEAKSTAKPHYILELKEPTVGEGKYRCISCGETALIVKVHNMTNEYKDKSGRSEADALKARESLIASLITVDLNARRDHTRELMLQAGVYFLNEAEPPEITGVAL